MQESDFKSLNFSLLGKETSLEGEFTFSGDTIINCQMKGKLTVINDGKLTFERDSKFEGNIFCKNIEVFGKVSGTIDADGTLSVRASAEVSGQINAKKMSIFPGASINIEGHTTDSTSH